MILRTPPRGSCARTLGPASSKRFFASATSRPCSADTPSPSRLSREACECGGEALRSASAPVGVEFVTLGSAPAPAARPLLYPGTFALRVPSLRTPTLGASTDHQHGPVRVAQLLLGDAPDQDVLQPGHAFGTQDYRIGPHLLRHGEDRLLGSAKDDQRLALHTGLLCQCLHLSGRLPAVLREPLAF